MKFQEFTDGIQNRCTDSNFEFESACGETQPQQKFSVQMHWPGPRLGKKLLKLPTLANS